MACNMSTEKFHSSIERRGSDGTTETESCNIKEREGGRVAWLTVVGSILVYYCSAGLVNSFGFFQAYYTRDFLDGTQTSTIAFIGTLQICLVNVLAAVSGTLCDFYGVKVSFVESKSPKPQFLFWGERENQQLTRFPSSGCTPSRAAAP
jgi:MCP family monocarboxylic acid transporter-like MFS transporter 10